MQNSNYLNNERNPQFGRSKTPNPILQRNDDNASVISKNSNYVRFFINLVKIGKENEININSESIRAPNTYTNNEKSETNSYLIVIIALTRINLIKTFAIASKNNIKGIIIDQKIDIKIKDG